MDLVKNNANQVYQIWADYPLMDAGLKAELMGISGDTDQISDRFYRDLAFGTAGLRGEMGVGTNRMNIYTVGKATQGLATYLRGHYEKPSVCIGFDTRNNSHLFAQRAAEVFAANGVKVYLFDATRPVPMISFGVPVKGASAGVMITASHNPKAYNGYKVYNHEGNQITDEAAAEILAAIGGIDPFADVKSMAIEEAKAAGLLISMGEEVEAAFLAKVKSMAIRPELIAKEAAGLTIIYTPLNGAGNLPVRRVLGEQGYTNLHVVDEQTLPNGNFPTTPYPNPEVPEVYALALDMAKTINPDLIFATDPDCDRIGVVAKNQAGEYQVLTGNQTGVLLTDYVIRGKREMGTLPANGAVISTVVSTPMTRAICDQNNVFYQNTLTGFKYMGELAESFKQSGQHTTIFSFEESFGYMVGDYVRDKDAVTAASLVCEMALYYQNKGLSLFDAMENLYEEYGFFLETGSAFTFPGAEGVGQMTAMVEGFRADYAALLAPEQPVIFDDFKTATRTFCQTGATEPFDLPSSNFVKLIFGDDSWFVLRPSGTEPKIKVYLGAKGKTRAKAADRLAELSALAGRIVK